MEELIGPDVEVILTLREVTDVGFVNVPFLAVATLFENPMETDVYDPDTTIRLNTDLVWETTKANIKKMRNSNLPIKINFYKFLGENHKEKFGYVILNLKSAQYMPRNKEVKISEDYVKILGLSKEAKGSTPLLLKSLSIRDKVIETITTKGNANMATENLKENIVDDFETARESREIEESQFYNESGQMYKVGNVKIGEGLEIITSSIEKPPSPNRSPRTKHSLSSGANERRAILNTYEKQVSSGDLQPQRKYVQAYHNYKLEIRLENILWLKVPPRFRFRFHQSRSEILSTAHPEITVERADEIVQLCDIRATFNFVETPSEFYKLIQTVPPAVSISCNMQNRPAIIARGVLETDKLSHTGDETIHKIELVDMKSHETIAKLTYAAILLDLGPQVMKDVVLKYKTGSSAEEKDLPPAIFENVTEKIVDELEDWKERQKEQFQHEFTEKLQREMALLRAEWMEKRKELEKKVNDRMEQCRQLGSSLIDATEDVKQKNKEVLEKEKYLEATKNELESRYLKLLTEKKEESEKLQEEFEKKLKEKDLRIEELEREKNGLEKHYKELSVKNDELNVELTRTESEFEKTKKTYLSQDQTATLLQDLKTMQEKLEAANNSKLFFKEQWGRAVREIHRIKSEYTKNIQIQLQYRKDELKKLGLEQLFLAEKSKNNLERDDILEAKDFLPSEFPEARSSMSDIEFPYRAKANFETFKTNMDIVKENNNYLLKFNQESEEKLKKLIEERDKLLCDGGYKIDDENVVRLNREIRNLLEH